MKSQLSKATALAIMGESWQSDGGGSRSPFPFSWPCPNTDCSLPPLAAVVEMFLHQRLSSDPFFRAIACKSVWSDRSLLLGWEGMGKAAACSCLLLPGNKLWWADQASERMGTCNKKDGTEVTVLRNSTTLVMHMKVYDETIQQGEGRDPAGPHRSLSALPGCQWCQSLAHGDRAAS